MDAQILYAALLLGLIPAVIAKRKGYTFLGWWLMGAMFFIIALPWAIIMGKNPAKYRRCPSCQQWIDPKATACPHCGRDVPALPPAFDPERARQQRQAGRFDRADWPWLAFIGAVLAIGLGMLVWVLSVA